MELRYLDRTDEVIKEEMTKETDEKVIKLAGTFLNDSYGASSIKLAEVYVELNYLNQKRNINNLTGNELDMHIEEKAGKQVVRRNATYAKGMIEAKGNDGTVISEASLMTINDIDYKTLERAVIKNGLLEVEIECVVAGDIGNIRKGFEVTLTNNISGIDEVNLITDIRGGYEEETDESLIERYLSYIQMPPTSGNVYHYIHWAKQIEGIGDVKIIPLWKGDNTVKLVVTDSNMETANEDLIHEVQEHIDPGVTGLGEGEAPIGAFCTVVSAIRKDIIIDVILDLNVGFTIEDVKEEVFNNVNAHMRKLTFSESEVSYAKVGAAILFTDGVKDYKELKINGAKQNIVLADEETAVLKEVVISE